MNPATQRKLAQNPIGVFIALLLALLLVFSGHPCPMRLLADSALPPSAHGCCPDQVVTPDLPADTDFFQQDDVQVAALLSGVVLHDESQAIKAAACDLQGERSLRLTVTLGKYHLVKRMVATAGNRVEALHRVAIGGLALPATLASGRWTWLEAADLALLAPRSLAG